ncbi:MAG: hypothetical protein EBY98_05980 [Acidimicrobiia bacterium]|nr:hypothetical protein [Acidimicrobiia bacterium]
MVGLYCIFLTKIGEQSILLLLHILNFLLIFNMYILLKKEFITTIGCLWENLMKMSFIFFQEQQFMKCGLVLEIF